MFSQRAGPWAAPCQLHIGMNVCFESLELEPGDAIKMITSALFLLIVD